MEVGIEQTIRLKFGDTLIELSKEDAEKLYNDLADALGYEEQKDKVIYIPYNDWNISPTRICDPSPWKWYEWKEPCYITSGYLQTPSKGINKGSVTTSTNNS